MKKVLIIFLVVILSLSFSLSVFANELSETDELIIEFENQLNSQISKLNRANDIEISNELEIFRSLSRSEKLRVIEVANDPEVLFATINNGKNSKAQAQFDNHMMTNEFAEDIIFESTKEDVLENPIVFKAFDTRNSLETRKATYNKSVKVLGIKVFQVTNTMRYKRTGYNGTITEILTQSHAVTRSFVPLQVSFYNEYNEIYTGNVMARAEADATMSILVKGAWIIGNGESYIEVDAIERVWGDFYVYLN